MVRCSGYIEGPSVIGFYGMFESDYGDENTYMPYAVVTPTRMGSAILPFRCPSCKGIRTEFNDKDTREKYHDTRSQLTLAAGKPVFVKHNNYWCPECRARFYLILEGMTPDVKLDPNTVAPSKLETRCVDENGKITSTSILQDMPDMLGKIIGSHRSGIDVLGALSAPNPTAGTNTNLSAAGPAQKPGLLRSIFSSQSVSSPSNMSNMSSTSNMSNVSNPVNLQSRIPAGNTATTDDSGPTPEALSAITKAKASGNAAISAGQRAQSSTNQTVRMIGQRAISAGQKAVAAAQSSASTKIAGVVSNYIKNSIIGGPHHISPAALAKWQSLVVNLNQQAQAADLATAQTTCAISGQQAIDAGNAAINVGQQTIGQNAVTVGTQAITMAQDPTSTTAQLQSEATNAQNAAANARNVTGPQSNIVPGSVPNLQTTITSLQQAGQNAVTAGQNAEMTGQQSMNPTLVQSGQAAVTAGQNCVSYAATGQTYLNAPSTPVATINAWIAQANTYITAANNATQMLSVYQPGLAQTIPQWQPYTQYPANAQVVNQGNLYHTSYTGMSGAGMGPYGNGVNIVDNTIRWNYAGIAPTQYNQPYGQGVPYGGSSGSEPFDNSYDNSYDNSTSDGSAYGNSPYSSSSYDSSSFDTSSSSDVNYDTTSTADANAIFDDIESGSGSAPDPFSGVRASDTDSSDSSSVDSSTDGLNVDWGA